MMELETTLYPCGSKVNVPFLSVSSICKSSPDVRHKISSSSSTKPRKPLTKCNQSQQIISELVSNLKFEDQVITTHCPGSVSYGNANKRITELCNPNGIVMSHCHKSHDIGRCNMRGDGRRHMPCNLQSTSIKLPTTSRKIPVTSSKSNSKGIVIIIIY